MQEIFNQILLWVSLFVGLAALVVSFYTIRLTRQTERTTRESFQRAEDRMAEHYEKLKGVLAAIETRGAATEQSVKLAQDQLLNTITNLVNGTVNAKKPDAGEQIANQFFDSLKNDPEGGLKTIKSLAGLMQIFNSQERK